MTAENHVAIRSQGDADVNFYYANQPALLKNEHVRNMKADFEKNLWTFHYQHTPSAKTHWIQLSLNPLSGALRYKQTSDDQHTIHAEGVCELSAQGRDLFLEALAETTAK